MTAPVACRICLAMDTRLFTIASTPLQEIYEKMTNITLQNDDGRPVSACYICHYLLQKSRGFIEKAVRADELLKEIIKNGLQITDKSISMIDRTILHTSLSTTPVDCITVDVELKTDEMPVKVEQPLVKTETDVVVEFEDPVENTEDLELPTQDQSSESEDDMPLQAISTKNKIKGKLVKKRNAKTEKNGEAKKHVKVKIEVSEIILTKEEQLAQMMERAKSLNYINSPFKCNLCYKGFVDVRAFRNHKEKHDERAGAFSCGVCRLRYRSARLLRAHEASSHARRYLCATCDHRSHTAHQAREHEKWHNGHTYECQLCGQAFRKSTSYLTHMRKRHPSEHVCEACGDGFVGRLGLLMHKSKAHRTHQEKDENEETTKCFCSDCNVQFQSVAAWTRHILTSINHAHGSEQSVSCLACGVRVAGGALRAHVREHAPRPSAPPPPANRMQLPCDVCGLSFANRSKLQAHVRRIHLGLKYNKNIVCEVCGKKCTSNASLRNHQRTHTGERPYPCPSCPKRFSDNNQLRIHQRTHSGERPYACRACPKRFSQKPALNRHYRIHTGAKPYACQFCAKTFSQSNSLKLHVRSVHLKLPHKKKGQPSTEQTQDTQDT